MGSSLFLLISFLLMISGLNSFIAPVEAKSKLHIVYMGDRQYKEPDLTTESHHQIEEAARNSMVYSYRHGFSGFAAKLTETEAKRIAGLPGVVHVMPNHFYTMQTTRSWEFLGLSSTDSSANNLLRETNMGDGVIVGVFDSGIWPESAAFVDEGLGPIPTRWKGQCVSGDQFNGKTNCNKKLIGAKWFVDGFLAEYDQQLNTTEYPEFFSARDAVGHGTHTSSIATGSLVKNASYIGGLAAGTARGGAPRARIAMYKACWNAPPPDQCSAADLFKAFDEAIHDGVDLISISIGLPIPFFSEVDVRNVISFGSFHAVAKGIPVISSAGNTLLPSAQSVYNTAPWILTVAASNIDRSFPTQISLGNNVTILGQSIYTGKEVGFTGLVYPESAGIVQRASSCETLSFNYTSVAGNVVLCFTSSIDPAAITNAIAAVKQAGGVGVIVAKSPTNIMFPSSDPYVTVDFELGTRILLYIRSARSPVVKISPSKTLTSKTISTKVAYFSCRGPNSLAPAILKPDIAAPGVSILAASSPLNPLYYNGFALQTGTSMATPHAAGIVALIKALHPTWSPAAIKSAIITTGSKTDPFGEPIFAEGSPRKLADPFDYGGGLVNPEKAAEPGLVYDMDVKDYIHYLCAMGYNDSSISLLVQKVTNCPRARLSILDVNLPSITIPNLMKTVILTRTVTNVGPVNSIYKAMIEPPFGISVAVKPEILVFNSSTKTISFKIIVSTTHRKNTGYYFGSLTWTDGKKHAVTSPVSVRTQTIQSYTDDN